jgi:hypothetical protein
MQHLEGSGTPVLYMGRTVLKGEQTLTQLVEALRYKPEGRGFDSLCYHWNF